MKLRIQDDALRLRLTRREVEDLGNGKPIERAIHFPGGETLTYAVAGSAKTGLLSVAYTGKAIRVTLPNSVVAAWAKSNEVTIEGTDGGVHVLVEKDFQCLHQGDARDPEAFPNPSAEH